MSRVFIVLSAIAASAGLLVAQQELAFRARTHTVSVYATVADRAGRLVPNLTREDFEVFDNGKRQELTLFTNDVQPITVVIMLDRSGSIVRSFDLVQGAAEQFVSKLLDDDRARIGSFGRGIQIDPAQFTNDKDELVRILDENLPEAGPATPLWNATAQAMTALAHQDGRRVVLIFTDGYDSPAGPGPHVRFEEVRDRSRAEDVMVYAIGLTEGCDPVEADRIAGASGATGARFQARGRPGRGPGRGRQIPGGPGRGRGGRIPLPPIVRVPRLPNPPKPGGDLWNRPASKACTPQKPDPDLKELAAGGGGGYFELNGTQDIAATFARVADELHHQYLLAFTATKLDGKPHTLEVRVRRPDLVVRARKGYAAPRAK